MHVSRGDSLIAEVDHNLADHDSIPQLAPVFIDQHHLVSLRIINAVIIVCTNFVFYQEVELRIHYFYGYIFTGDLNVFIFIFSVIIM